jgi:predicted TIM-barrel fold metal-dependent hydrolase
MYSQSTLCFCSHTKTDLPVPRADLTDLDLTDAHVHVFDPKRFPYAAERSYTPGEATVAQLRERHRQLRVQRAVLVQPSVYGTDNACLLDAVSALGLGRARGIAVADLRQMTRHALMDWNARGIRGLRLNLEVQHEADPDRVRVHLREAAAVVDIEGWCVQLHCASSLLPVVEEVLPEFRVPLVLDHFAGLRSTDAAADSPGLRTLLRLLGSGRVYVKISAFYRASSQAPHHEDLGPLVRTLVEAQPNRLLWGSDWPHTGGGSSRRDPSAIEPFRNVDLAAHLVALKSWCLDDAVRRRILVDNPAELYGFATLGPTTL